MQETKESIREARAESLIYEASPITIDDALDQIGGYGLFQFLTTLACTLIRSSGQYFFLGFGFLTLKQRYVCFAEDGSLYQCSIETVCQGRVHGLRYQIDTAYEDYLENWQQEMRLECESQSTINLLSMAYFLAVGVTGLLLFTLPDRWGCRKTLAVFGTLSSLAQFMILFVPNYYARLAGLVVMGFAY